MSVRRTRSVEIFRAAPTACRLWAGELDGTRGRMVLNCESFYMLLCLYWKSHRSIDIAGYGFRFRALDKIDILHDVISKHLHRRRKSRKSH